MERLARKRKGPQRKKIPPRMGRQKKSDEKVYKKE